MFRGTSEMSVVLIGRLLAVGAASINVIAANEGAAGSPGDGGWEFGYDRLSVSPPEVYLGMSEGGIGSLVYGECRGMVAADVGKVHRWVCTGSVATGDMFGYTNGHRGPLTGAITSFVEADTAPLLNGVIGSVGTNGLDDIEVCDIAVIDRAFTAAEVEELDKLILSTGNLPSYDWVHHFKAERLINYDLVLDAGGLNAGRGFIADAGIAPILGSVLIHPQDWGGSGA